MQKIQLIILFSFLLGVSTIFAQDVLKLKKGATTSIRLTDTLKKSEISVFVPKSFSLETSWPLLIHLKTTSKVNRDFKNWIHLFEKMNFVAVSLDVSSQQDVKKNLAFIKNNLNELVNRLPIDSQRIYSIGKNNDAQFTSILPIIFPFVEGTIAIENTFDFARIPNFKKRFYFAGISDKTKHTYLDFKHVRKVLKQNRISAEVYIKKPTLQSELANIEKALYSFQIKDMTRNRIQKDSFWLKERFEKNYARALSFIRDKKYVEGYQELKRMDNTYRFIYDTKIVKEELKALERLPKYRKQKMAIYNNTMQEKQWKDIFFSAIKEDMSQKAFYNIPWWENESKRLRKIRTLAKNRKYHWTMRVENFLEAILNQTKSSIHPQDVERKLLLSMIENKINPQKPQTYFEIISYLASLYDHKTAIVYLEQLLQTGYKNRSALYEIKNTLALKITPEYNDMIKKYLGSSKYSIYN